MTPTNTQGSEQAIPNPNEVMDVDDVLNAHDMEEHSQQEALGGIMSSTDFREQVLQTLGVFEEELEFRLSAPITKEKIDTIVKLHKAEAERIIGEDDWHGDRTNGYRRSTVDVVRNKLRAEQRQRAAITPKEDK